MARYLGTGSRRRARAPAADRGGRSRAGVLEEADASRRRAAKRARRRCCGPTRPPRATISGASAASCPIRCARSPASRSITTSSCRAGACRSCSSSSARLRDEYRAAASRASGTRATVTSTSTSWSTRTTPDEIARAHAGRAAAVRGRGRARRVDQRRTRHRLRESAVPRRSSFGRCDRADEAREARVRSEGDSQSGEDFSLGARPQALGCGHRPPRPLTRPGRFGPAPCTGQRRYQCGPGPKRLGSVPPRQASPAPTAQRPPPVPRSSPAAPARGPSRDPASAACAA